MLSDLIVTKMCKVSNKLTIYSIIKNIQYLFCFTVKYGYYV